MLRSDTICDFTSQMSGKLGSPITTGSFGDVYRCTIQSSKGETEVGMANPSPSVIHIISTGRSEGIQD
jgi:hypothetical protein